MAPVAKVAVTFHYHALGPTLDVPGAFTFHVEKTPSAEPWNAGDLDVLIGRTYQWIADPDPPAGTDWEPLTDRYSEAMHFDSITAWPVSPSLGDPEGVVIDESGPRSPYANDPYPQLAFGIGLRTTVDTRRGRGRIYLPMWQDLEPQFRPVGLVDDLDRERLARRGACLARRIFGDDPETADPWALCVYSRISDTSHAVTHFAICDRVLTQRRRAVRPLTYQTWGLDATET